MRLGTDIIEIDRIAKAVMKSKHFGERVFAASERAYAKSRGKQEMASLAGMYAAKEAFFKALGTGFRGGSWHEIYVQRDELGAPHIICNGKFKAMLQERGFSHIEVSISHCRDYATATVILTK
ncbi:MAG: holo-ACP synthase [Veillonella sp.]|uniref:holo-ACP synthase n=1 Tax=Veillonella sp. TaxID=1926307 RepID=UPI0025DF515D|nr:holo-ACP synthase [Veillonella sp.]MBS4912715.1 holo-ACP synthase [Veillonella sp.]